MPLSPVNFDVQQPPRRRSLIEDAFRAAAGVAMQQAGQWFMQRTGPQKMADPIRGALEKAGMNPSIGSKKELDPRKGHRAGYTPQWY